MTHSATKMFEYCAIAAPLQDVGLELSVLTGWTGLRSGNVDGAVVEENAAILRQAKTIAMVRRGKQGLPVAY